MYARAQHSYKKTYLESASPARLIDEMYLRLLRDIEVGRTGIAEKDPKKRGEALSHGMAIVGALHTALDRRLAPKLCAELGSLYIFINARLSRANVHNDVKALDEAVKIINKLRESFQEAALKAE
jgi:flagellar protein FliS